MSALSSIFIEILSFNDLSLSQGHLEPMKVGGWGWGGCLGLVWGLVIGVGVCH